MSLARNAMQGAAWTVATGLISRGMGLVGTLVLTRFLAPAVMGEVVTAAVVAFMASWATQLGINQYILVRAAEGETDPVFHATVLSLGLALIALTAVTLAAPAIGPILNAPNMTVFLPGMALAVFVRRIGGIPEKLLLRRLQFRAVAAATALGEVAYVVTSITLVVTTDLGGTVIVIGNIVQSFVIAGITIAICGISSWITPSRLRWARIKEILVFGLPLGIEAFLYESARYGDKLIYTRLFGVARTGEYNLAYNLADLPATYVGEQVSNVFLPMLLRVETEQRKAVLLRALGMLALVTFPMAVGLAVVSQTLVDVLLPDNWNGVAPFLSVLAAVSVFRPINGFISQYLISIERNQRLMWLEAMRVAVLFGGLILLGLAGPIVAAFAVGLAAFAHTIGLLQSIHGDGKFLKSLLGRFRAPVLACVVMAVAVLGLRWLVGPADGVREGLLLAAEIILGAVSYGAAMLFFGRLAALEMLSLMRDALQRRGAA